MVKVGGSGNSQGFTLGYSRDRPIRGSSHSLYKAIINRFRRIGVVTLYPANRAGLTEPSLQDGRVPIFDIGSWI